MKINILKLDEFTTLNELDSPDSTFLEKIRFRKVLHLNYKKSLKLVKVTKEPSSVRCTSKPD